jgi:HEAT repeat protein
MRSGIVFLVLLLAQMLGQTGNAAPWRPSAESVMAMLKLPLNERMSVLKEQPESVYSTLIEIKNLKQQPMALRWKALTTAALLNKKRAVTDLEKASHESEWFIRNAAMVAMVEVSSVQGLKVARRLASDPALVVRSAAIDLLGQSSDASDRQKLWTELDASYNKRAGQSLWIRKQIVDILSKKPLMHEKQKFQKLQSEPDFKLTAKAALTQLF